MKRIVTLLLVFAISGCGLFQQADRFGARPVAFESLAGWEQDDHVKALKAFLASCPILARKSRPATSGSAIEISAALWQSLCKEAAAVRPVHARAFFERRFQPFRVNNHGKEEGLFTGYYEPVLYGATHRYGDFQYPLYAAPPELASSKPYHSHAEINAGALDGRKLEILWVDDPVMRFFMQIQGSGRVKLTNRRELYVGYADQNGHTYSSIGKVMGDEGMLQKGEINFFSIRQWLYQNPNRAFSVMERNPSYVFFKIREEKGAVGAVGAVLTPRRSIAVDSRYIPYGLPVYLEAELPPEPQREPQQFNHLMVAQDTGGAIKGPVRADIFFGTGDEAEYFAGYMAKRGVYTLLVPKEIASEVRVNHE